MKQVLYFSLGAAIGSLVTWLCVKGHYEKKADEEIRSMREDYEDDMQKLTDQIVDLYAGEDKDIEKEPEDEIVEDDDYITYDDFPREERADKPYVIGPDVYSEDFHGFDKCVLVYWRGNDTLLTDEQEMMDIETTITREALEHFGEYESGTVFVRNERLGCDFEVLLEEGSWAD